jgi:chromosome segregation ATPase
MEVVWGKVVAIRKGNGYDVTVDKVRPDVAFLLTEHGALVETDIPYLEAVEKLLSAQGRSLEKADAAEGVIEHVTKERDEAIHERDELRKFNEGFVEELTWEKDINRSLLADLKTVRNEREDLVREISKFQANIENEREWRRSEQLRLIRDREWQLDQVNREVQMLKEQITRTEAELARTKAELALTKGELAQTKAELAQAKKDLIDAEIQHRRDRDAY